VWDPGDRFEELCWMLNCDRRAGCQASTDAQNVAARRRL